MGTWRESFTEGESNSRRESDWPKTRGSQETLEFSFHRPDSQHLCFGHRNTALQNHSCHPRQPLSVTSDAASRPEDEHSETLSGWVRELACPGHAASTRGSHDECALPTSQVPLVGKSGLRTITATVFWGPLGLGNLLFPEPV